MNYLLEDNSQLQSLQHPSFAEKLIEQVIEFVLQFDKLDTLDQMMKNNEPWNYYLMFDEHQMLMDKLF